jgi:hypothetical protein
VVRWTQEERVDEVVETSAGASLRAATGRMITAKQVIETPPIAKVGSEGLPDPPTKGNCTGARYSLRCRRWIRRSASAPSSADTMIT